ncbi:ABC transporter substrate-binding protein [Umezawaea beigongshangensis]|uniref:ABC transporter substrate-binding protein n=1 Tax=Umezawaea beigongshangensis TaxID=2780383 RepID=UPI0027DD2066|nr:sugar ABC transporter substrate-binding protein [Umezawaea beigongshangensis]
MGPRRGVAAWTAAGVAVALGLAGCGGSEDSGAAGAALTYWASNQGTSLDHDRQVLTPELEKFEQRTGISVELEVIPWTDLQNRVLAATASGEGPDVVNIGNTWSASLQATGAFLPFDEQTIGRVGGEDRFLASTLTSTGAEGRPPVAVPLYGLAYGLFYNKRLFAEAGIAQAPRTWAEFVDAAKKLTVPEKRQWGLGIMGASYTENAHFAFIFGRQNGARPFEGDEPRLDSPQMVDGVSQYVDLLSTHRVVNPSDAEYVNDTQVVKDFAAGRTAMIMIQNYATAAIRSNGMADDAYGVAPIPVLDPLPPGGKKISSHVAGINVGVFANSDDTEGALEFVDFLTSTEEQKILNGTWGSLPVVREAYDDPRFRGPLIDVFQQVLAESAETMPMVPAEAQFETLVGTAVKDVLADAASGETVDEQVVEDALAAADQRMRAGG